MNSTIPSPHDALISTVLGWELMRAFIKTIIFALIYGIFVLLFMHSARVYFLRKQPRKSQHWMFAVTTVTFALTTIHGAVMVVEMSSFIRSAFVDDQNSSVIVRYQRASNLMMKPNIAILWFNVFEIFISDCVVVWRAYVLSPHKRWPIILPLFLLLCSVVSILPPLLGMATNKRRDWEAILALTNVGLSLATNAVATGLISNVYWTHRREMTSGLGAHRATPVERVLALLTESGVLFCMLQSAALILALIPPQKPGTPHYYLQAITSAAFYGFAAVYPTAVIALVNSQRTFDQMYSINAFPQSRGHDMNRNSAAIVQDIVFARPPTTNITNTTDHETT